MDDPVVIQKGKSTDCTGRVCRICIYTCMLWVHLDKHAGTDYASVGFGPFFASELIFNPALKEEQQQCLPLTN